MLVSCDHDFVQLLFASGDTRPSVILVREVDALGLARHAEMALPFICELVVLAVRIAVCRRLRPELCDCDWGSSHDSNG